MVILQEVPTSEAAAAEFQWIERRLDEGAPLFNRYLGRPSRRQTNIKGGITVRCTMPEREYERLLLYAEEFQTTASGLIRLVLSGKVRLEPTQSTPIEKNEAP